MGNRGGEYSAILIMFAVLSFVSVCLRCFVRWRWTGLGWDDFLAVLAMLTFLAMCIGDVYGIWNGGVAHHIWDVSVKTYQVGLQTLLVGELLYMASTSLIKVTFSLTLLRVVNKTIFPHATVIIYIIISVVVIQANVFFFYTLFSCKPVQYLWLQLDPSKTGHCQSHVMSTSIVHGAVIFCCDTTLAIMVGYLISNLRLGLRTKIASGMLLGLGSISSIVTLARFPFIHTINEPDVLYAITDLSILACAEVGTCIIATSAGTLRPLFVRAPEEGRNARVEEREGRRGGDIPSSQGEMTTAQAGSTGEESIHPPPSEKPGTGIGTTTIQVQQSEEIV